MSSPAMQFFLTVLYITFWISTFYIVVFLVAWGIQALLRWAHKEKPLYWKQNGSFIEHD